MVNTVARTQALAHNGVSATASTLKETSGDFISRAEGTGDFISRAEGTDDSDSVGDLSNYTENHNHIPETNYSLTNWADGVP